MDIKRINNEISKDLSNIKTFSSKKYEERENIARDKM